MSEFRLATPTARARLSDGRVLEARVLNPDYLRFDRTAAKHNWPKAAEAPFLWQTFLAWSAFRRTGQIAESVTWEEFSDHLAEQVELEGLGPVEDEEAERNGTTGVDPTLEILARG
jgi:hypothetical protein